MKVHYLDPANPGWTACGYLPQPRNLGLDFVTTWNALVATPVNCLECLMHRPKQRKVKTWEGVGRKVR